MPILLSSMIKMRIISVCGYDENDENEENSEYRAASIGSYLGIA